MDKCAIIGKFIITTHYVGSIRSSEMIGKNYIIELEVKRTNSPKHNVTCSPQTVTKDTRIFMRTITSRICVL